MERQMVDEQMKRLEMKDQVFEVENPHKKTQEKIRLQKYVCGTNAKRSLEAKKPMTSFSDQGHEPV